MATIFSHLKQMAGYFFLRIQTDVAEHAILPEKIFYLNRNKIGVNPQYRSIDKVLNIDGHYLNNVIKDAAQMTLVDFETEFNLLSDWMRIKKKGNSLSAQDKVQLKTIADQCLNQVVVQEMQALLNRYPGSSGKS